MHRSIDISLPTIKYNLKRFEETKSLEYRGDHGRPRQINVLDNAAISQYIRTNNEIISKKEFKKNYLSHIRQSFLSQQLIVIYLIIIIVLSCRSAHQCL
jgi:hypothetical protein